MILSVHPLRQLQGGNLIIFSVQNICVETWQGVQLKRGQPQGRLDQCLMPSVVNKLHGCELSLGGL